MSRLDPSRLPWRPLGAALVCAASASGYLLVRFLGAGWLRPESGVLVRRALAAGAFGLPPVVYLLLRRVKPLRLWVPGGAELARDLAAGLVLALLLATVSAMAVKVAVSRLACGAAPRGALERVVWDLEGFGRLIPVLVGVGVLSPLGEEVFFRGFLYPALRMRLGAPIGVGLSAAVFALAHPGTAVPQAFILGLVAALIVEYTGSLLPGLLAHMGVNVSFVMCLAAEGRLARRLPMALLAAAFVALNIVFFALGKVLFAPEAERAEGKRG